jgi:DNA-binding CsgD family transcriptional regulator
MGSAYSGRRRDQARRQQVVQLRAQGMSVADIARRLGLTRQGVLHHLRPVAVPGAPAVYCRRCGAIALPANSNLREPRPALCPACVAQQPGVPFSAILRAYRLAAGYTRAELARRSGVHANTVLTCESAGRGRPRRDTVAKLVRVLGPGLLATGAPAAEGAGHEAGCKQPSRRAATDE